jgi:hypothetical protein
MRMWMRPFAFSAILALGITGCEEGTTDPTAFDFEALNADVALVAADGMFQDLAHMQGPILWGGIGVGPEVAGIEFEGSRRFSKKVTFFDASGEEQSKYDPLTTASMRIESELEREVSHTFWSAEIERKRDMTVTGMEGEETERTWNGDAEGEVSKSRHPEGGTEREYEMTSSAVIENVVRGVPRATNPYPKSGSITRTIHAEITVDGVTEVKDIVATITFDGDNTATMTVGNDTWEVNLDDQGVRKRFQRPKG